MSALELDLPPSPLPIWKGELGIEKKGNMKKEKIVTGQKVTPQKVQRARELRREMTSAERRLWNRIRANRLGGWHFRRQQIIDGFIVDFYCHKAGLVVEVDGPIHQRQKLADSERTQALAGRGLKVIRFTNCEVMNNIQQVLRSILSELESDTPSLEGKGPGDGSNSAPPA